jgi:hypothetical protein
VFLFTFEVLLDHGRKKTKHPYDLCSFHGHQTCDCKHFGITITCPNEQNVALIIIIIFIVEKTIQEIKWCGAMKGLEDSWNDTFWVVYMRECFANI